MFASEKRGANLTQIKAARRSTLTQVQNDYQSREDDVNLSKQEQEKISRILNAQNLDDKTKFLRLAALQSEIHRTRVLPTLKRHKMSSVTTNDESMLFSSSKKKHHRKLKPINQQA